MMLCPPVLTRRVAFAVFRARVVGLRWGVSATPRSRAKLIGSSRVKYLIHRFDRYAKRGLSQS